MALGCESQVLAGSLCSTHGWITLPEECNDPTAQHWGISPVVLCSVEWEAQGWPEVTEFCSMRREEKDSVPSGSEGAMKANC